MVLKAGLSRRAVSGKVHVGLKESLPRRTESGKAHVVLKESLPRRAVSRKSFARSPNSQTLQEESEIKNLQFSALFHKCWELTHPHVQEADNLKGEKSY